MARKTLPKNAARPAAAKSAALRNSVPPGARLDNGPPAARLDNGLSDALGMNSSGFPFQTAPGTEQISSAGTIFKNLRYYLISNFRQVLAEAYVELGLVQTIVNVPVDDGLRGGLVIASKQLDEAQIKDLTNAQDRDDDLATAGQAMKWTRLFGGGAILIITDQDPETPLNLDEVDKDSPLEFRALDMWELFWDRQGEDVSDFSAEIEADKFEHFNYYGKNVHKSRVLKLKGLVAPSFIRPRLRGWGFSVVEILVRSINQYLKATNLGFEVLDEFKLDVYRMKNLVNTLLSPNGAQKIQARVQLANWQKNYQNAIVMDSEDEFDHKQLSFAGLAEAMAGIRMQVASDMRMPLTKLFGISAAGFNSGEDDIEVYNAMVESEIRSKAKHPLLRMTEIKCQKLFGFIPDDLEIGFKPLRVMSSEQEETVKTSKFNRVLAAKTAGEISRFEFREACNKDNLLPITLDNAGDALNPDDPDVADLVAGEPEESAPGEGDGEEGDEEDDAKPPGGKAPKSQLQAKDAPKVKNTIAYERAAYEADGGDAQIPDGRRPFFEKLAARDGSLWKRANEAAVLAFGQENWKFAVWYFKRNGGKL
jgi:phage-related protein (TIGR01555 family)